MRIFGLLILFIAFQGLIANGGDSRNDNSDIEKIRLLTARRDIRLSSDAGSAAEEFSYDIVVSGPTISPMRLIVERDNKQLVVLAVSAEGLPYFYATDEFVAKLDSAEPGRLMIADDAHASVVLDGDPAKASYRFNLALNADASTIGIDPARVLESLLPRVQRVTASEDHSVLTINTRAAVVLLALSQQSDTDYPIKSLAIGSKSGVAIAIENIKTDDAHVSLPALTANQFDALPIATWHGRWTPENIAEQKAIPRADFWKDEKVRAAAKAMATLFDPALLAAARATAPATTRAATAPTQLANIGEEIRKGGLKTLAEEQQVLRELELSDDQRRRISALLAARRAAIATIAGQVAAGALAPADGLKEMRSQADLTGDLRGILSSTELKDYARRFLAQRPPRIDPIESMLARLRSECKKLDLSELQRTELEQLLREVTDQADELKRKAITRQATRAELSSSTKALADHLSDGLSRILTTRQFETLEEVLTAEMHRPSTGPTSADAPG